MDNLSLETRPGLPDALRILAERYPREAWDSHPEFNALTRFWLDRHLMFRDAQRRLVAGTHSYLDREVEARRFGAELTRLGGFFLNELHAHHHIEDEHYFPQLAASEPRLTRAFTLLDRDHHALDGGIQALAESANGVLGAIAVHAPGDVETGRLLAELERFERLLDRHLSDEEEIVVPVILEYRGAGLS